MSSSHGLELEQMKLKFSILTFLCLSKTYCKNALKKMKWVRCHFQQYLKQLVDAAYTLYPHLKGKFPLLFDKEYVVLPFASPLIPWFLRCWQVRVSAPELLKEFDVDHQKTGAFYFGKLTTEPQHGGLEKMIFLFNWVPCLGTMWILGFFSKQINELK